jgi:hypothetical protein
MHTRSWLAWCSHAHTPTHPHTHTPTHPHIRTSAHTHTTTHPHTHTPTHPNTHTSTHSRTHTPAHTHLQLCAHSSSAVVVINELSGLAVERQLNAAGAVRRAPAFHQLHLVHLRLWAQGRGCWGCGQRYGIVMSASCPFTRSNTRKRVRGGLRRKPAYVQRILDRDHGHRLHASIGWHGIGIKTRRRGRGGDREPTQLHQKRQPTAVRRDSDSDSSVRRRKRARRRRCHPPLSLHQSRWRRGK